MSEKGFKIFYHDWSGRGGFKFKVGECFEKEESPKVGHHGFHFCKRLIDCYDYFDIRNNNVKYATVEAYGQIDNKGDTEYATNKIKIVRELDWDEVKEQIFREVVCQ